MVEVIYVGGSKGGVGKSLLTMSVIDWLRANGKPVALVESDNANPDVAKVYQNLVETKAFNLDELNGWNELGDLIESGNKPWIVINSGARSLAGIQNSGHILGDLVEGGAADLTILWPINRTRDSILALKHFRSAISVGRVRVIKNLFFGDEARFTRWASSTIAEKLIEAGARVGVMPDMPDRIADKIYDERMAIEAIASSGNLVDKSNLARWRKVMHEALDELLA